MKNYKLEELNNLISNRVSKLEIPDELKMYITDILMRRAYQYDFTNEEVETDLDTLSYSLKSIDFNLVSSSTSGIYNTSKRSISINPLFFDIKNIYSTLAHELFHACTHNKDGIDRLVDINLYTHESNYSLNEAIIEKAAHKIVYPTIPKDPYYNKDANGYDRAVFIVDMLAATFGVTDQEIIKNGLQDKNKLIEYLTSKSGQPSYFTTGFLDKLELNYNSLCRMLYDDKKEKGHIPNKGMNVAEALGNMTKACMTMMNLRFESIPLEELNGEKFEDIKFDYNKLNSIVDKMSKSFSRSHFLRGFSTKRVMELSEEENSQLRNGILQTEYLRSVDISSLPNEIQTNLAWARWGALSQIDQEVLQTLEKPLPEREDSRENFYISPDAINRNSTPPNKTDSWDNSIINYKFRFVIIQNIIKSRTDGLKRIFSPKKEYLPEGNNAVKENPKKVEPVWTLNQEELNKVNEYNRRIKDGNIYLDSNKENKEQKDLPEGRE